MSSKFFEDQLKDSLSSDACSVRSIKKHPEHTLLKSLSNAINHFNQKQPKEEPQ